MLRPAAAEATDSDVRPQIISPLVRQLARDSGVDLRRVCGSGPGGLVTRRDVEQAAAEAGAARAAAAPEPVPSAAPSGDRSSPYARRLAAESGVELASLQGTGPGGAIVARDVPVEATARDVRPAAGEPGDVAAPAAEAAAGPTERVAPAGPTDREAAAAPEQRAQAMRQAIARAMEQSNREIPHYYLGETVDVEQSLAWLSEVNADRPPTTRLLSAVLVLKATALALRSYRDFNGYWIDDAFRPGDGIHVGVAINLRRGGLLAPAIRDADERSLDELMEALRDLVERTRAGGLRGSELTDPTITVSNLGDTGVETIQGVITPPQVAFVGVGRITPRPWAVDGMLGVRRTVYLGLAGDHRASDGHRGGRFLAAIAANLTRPEAL